MKHCNNCNKRHNNPGLYCYACESEFITKSNQTILKTEGDDMKLTKDDYDLTLKNFKSERVQLKLQLECCEATIGYLDQMIKKFPVDIDQSDDPEV